MDELLSPEELEAIQEYLSDGEYVDDVGAADELELDTSRLVVFAGLPIAPARMAPKLGGFLGKRVAAAGAIAPDGTFIPCADGKTLGFAFVEFVDSTGAATAISNFHNAPFDKSHTMKLYKYDDFKHCEVADKLELPEEEPFVARRDLTSWLQDDRMRDHFAIRYDDETEVHWMESNGRPVLVYGGEREKDAGVLWTENYILWSPQGTYLLTFSSGRGVVLWGGHTFEKIGRMAHEGCHEAEWSPCERYLCTWNGYECYGSDMPLPTEALIVWDVRTCTPLRKLPQVDRELGSCDASWSFDGSYLARRAFDAVTNDVVIKVYEMPECTILKDPSGKKRSIRAKGAREVQWAPGRANVLAWWSPELGQNDPASVTIMELPSRRVLKQKNLFNVEEPQLIWHPDGDYVCLQALHLTKAQMKRKKQRERAEAEGTGEIIPERTTIATSFDLFRIKGRVTAEVLEVKDKVAHFAWEPKGDRFGVVHGIGTAHRYSISFYTMGEQKHELLYTLTDRACNQLIWSPLGGTCVLAGLDALSGKLEFYDVDEEYSYTEREHIQCNLVAFDPSGRFVVTAKSQPMLDIRDVVARDAYDNGFMLWTFQGNRIHEEGKKRFFQFAWRPRPRSLLTDAQEAEVRTNLQLYIRRYQEEDNRAARRRKLRGLISKRRQRDEFRAIMADLHEEFVKEKPLRQALGVVDDEGVQVTRTTYDEVLSQEVVKEK